MNKKIRTIFGKDSDISVPAKLGIIPNGAEISNIVMYGTPKHSKYYPWYRSGSETLGCHFEIDYLVEEREFSRNIFAKAVCVDGVDLMNVFQSWVRRREILSSFGCPVVPSYAASKGVFYDLFLPYSLREFTENENTKNSIMKIEDSLEELSGRKIDIRDIYREIRTDNRGNAFVVDVGFDIAGLFEKFEQH